MELKIDPEFESKIPPLTEEEFRQLEENILADGVVINPIIIWNGVIVDGHNRFHIIEKHPQIQYTTHEKAFADRFAVIAWICKNQLGRRNLTPEQKKYLIGKQYEAEKKRQGTNNQYVQAKSESCQVGNFHSEDKTCERIAKENGIGMRSVIRAEAFSKAVDIADEVEPGIRENLLSGEIKATEKDIRELVSAEPEERPVIVDRMRHPPPPKPPKTEESKKRKPPDPEIAAIKQIAADMLEPKYNGKPSTMIYEMKDALESMTYRWDFCKTNYAPFFEMEECRSQIRKLIRNGYEFLEQYEGGLSHYDNA